MPVNLPRGKTAYHEVGTGNLLRRLPKHIAVIGAIALEWSYIEDQLAYHYASLVGFNDMTANTIAFNTFNSILSFQQKRDFFLKAFDIRFRKAQYSALRKMAKDQLKTLQAAGVKRNKIIHGRWGQNDEYPDALIHTNSQFSKSLEEIYTLADLEAVHETVQVAIRQFSLFWVKEAFPIIKRGP